MLQVGHHSGEHRAQRVMDGREHFRARQHARRAALGDKNAIGCQLRRHDVLVEVLSVQLRTKKHAALAWAPSMFSSCKLIQ